jgi:5-methyltetrahydrofolate--homocysteine methyltransferase
VYYGKDAFEGLRIMDRIVSGGDETGPVHVAPKRTSEPKTGVELPPIETVPVPKAPFFGWKKIEDIRTEELFEWINKIALFRAQWQFRRGHLSAPDYERLIQEKVEPIYESLKKKCLDEKILQPAAVYGYYLCASERDDLIVFDETGFREITRFHFPRQSRPPGLCVADFFRKVNTAPRDVIAVQLVTVGPRASEISQALFRSNAYTDYLYLHGLSVEAAEALAEIVHARIRRELGIAGEDRPTLDEVFRQGYRGSRYSFGYPACPNLEDQSKLFRLIPAEAVGVTLTEEFHLVPEQSTSAIVVHHPRAKYFNV